MLKPEENSEYSTPVVLPLIAILAPISSSNISDASNETLPLFSIMLPSLVLSLDCGFRYMVAVGYLEGDPFFDTEQVYDNLQTTVAFFLFFMFRMSCCHHLAQYPGKQYSIALMHDYRVSKKRRHGFSTKLWKS